MGREKEDAKRIRIWENCRIYSYLHLWGMKDWSKKERAETWELSSKRERKRKVGEERGLGRIVNLP